ncbi:DUF4349 domain-containing protein [Mucilaginibacter gotjawali]|uniref:DUF4349 domain-containing protein n=1 Tax=Mucilaginibacter gotjawali TaxID=1550579 RepID=A0A839SCD8_9SPHI|nr:DUF4349 domain-containing protein [Mucilaginibacter gotjawali]MBB3054933.1 hypothetical protein [Mucilaginibacter gotjawali]
MKTKFLIPLAGLAFLCACKGKSGSYELLNNSSSADTVSKDSVSGPKLVKTAGIHFKVKNVQQTAEHITALTTGINGMVIHHQMGSTAGRSQDIRISNDSVMRVTAFNTTAEMTVKIPSTKLDEFLNQVGHLGIYVNDRSMDITDKSLDYLSAQLKLKSRAELVSQQKKGKIVIKKPEDVLNLKDDMIDQQIGNRQIDDAVKNSIVTLSFYQSNTINKEVIANDDPSAYNLPFFRRLGMAIENGWGIFVDVIIGMAKLWVFIIAIIGVWVLVRNYRIKKMIAPAKV